MKPPMLVPMSSEFYECICSTFSLLWVYVSLSRTCTLFLAVLSFGSILKNVTMSWGWGKRLDGIRGGFIRHYIILYVSNFGCKCFQKNSFKGTWGKIHVKSLKCKSLQKIPKVSDFEHHQLQLDSTFLVMLNCLPSPFQSISHPEGFLILFLSYRYSGGLGLAVVVGRGIYNI